ncbi:MAG: lysylphosphatidylglycerol synthase transmembrane domain-containing protein [Nakamurella sp.]
MELSELDGSDSADRALTPARMSIEVEALPGGATLVPIPATDRRRPRRTRWHKTWPKDPAAPGGIVDTSDEDPDDDTAQDDTPRQKSKWGAPLKVLGILVMFGVIAFALNGKLPKPSEVWAALLTANWLWVLVGAIAMFISIFAFAEQQRQLLAAFDTRISRKRITVITYGGTALTNSLPAGAAVSAGYSFTQYRAGGANRSTAATVMVLSGLLSIGSLAVMYFAVIGAATGTAFITLLQTNPVVFGVIGLTVLGLVAVYVRRRIKGRPEHLADRPTPKLDRFERRYPKLGALARDGLETLRQARLVRLKYLTIAIGWSLLKWATEAVCLLASCWAFNIETDLVKLSVVYLSVQLVRQVPFTPGGIGLVEAALLAGLVSAGAAHGAAAAAVVVYRLISAWLIIPIGFALVANLKRHDARRAAASTARA